MPNDLAPDAKRNAVRRAMLSYYPQHEVNRVYPFLEIPRLDVFDVSDSADRIYLVVTYRTGAKYCCPSPACCYPALFFDTDWRKLRQLLRAECVEPPQRIRLMIRTCIEDETVFALGLGTERCEYYDSSADEECGVTDEAFTEIRHVQCE